MSSQGQNNNDTFLDDSSPMLLEQFETAARKTKIQSRDLIGAARMVMVVRADGNKISVSEAAATHAVQEQYVYRAIKSIEKSWAKICKAQGWEIKNAALPPELWPVLEAIQLQALKNDTAVSGRASKRTKSKGG